MTLRRKSLFGVAALALAVAVTPALPHAHADIFVFKDGFTVFGRLKEKTEFIHDPNGAIPVPKAGQPMWIDDGFRNIYFSPGQLKEAISDKTKKFGADQVLTYSGPHPTRSLPLTWLVESSTPWDSRWERELTVKDAQGVKFKATQRITSLTPERVRIESTTHDWACYYNTKEFDPQKLRSLLYDYFTKKKENELDLRFKIHRFLLEADFIDQAEQEAEDMLRDFPKDQSRISPLKDAIKRIQAVELVLGLERSQQAGLHADVEKKLKTYADRKLDDLLDEKAQLQVQAVKEKHEGAKKKLLDAARLVKAFADITPPSKRQFFQRAAADIAQELNPDTVDRLDIFVNLAADYERAIKDKRQPEQSPAEVMAFALTGWLRGSDAAERNPDVAIQQWQTRQMLLDYLRNDDPLARKNKLLPDLRKANVSVDEAMQIIRRLPPADPFETLTAKPQSLQTKNNGKPVNYELLLPPGYSHGRAWPVLIALHHAEEKAAGALGPWAELAAQHGYIVVAPQWGKGAKATYQYSVQEHATVLETLRDLRRRFQIDSDRVFLFGCEQGGFMAFDVGFAHPDQFAGVVPMSAPPVLYAKRCWPNAQYLHLYVVNGDRATFSFIGPQGNPMEETYGKLTTEVFKDFIRGNYPAIFVEYKGRSYEWFGAERPLIFDWMNRKRRMHPLKEMGREGEAFRTMRYTDIQFYWVSTTAVKPAAGQQYATLRASVFNTTNEVHVRTSGIGPVTVWFEPNLVDYGKKVWVRRNDSTGVKAMVVPNVDTLLEKLYETGDRQRLYFAKVDL